MVLLVSITGVLYQWANEWASRRERMVEQRKRIEEREGREERDEPEEGDR
jgi:hypothetical protein